MEHQGNSVSPSIAVSNGISQQDQHPSRPGNPKGGLITMPFIIANEAFEKVASYGLQFVILFYLLEDYQLSYAKASALINYWNAVTSFAPLVGAFVADSYLGRFLTIGLASIISFLGTVLLWLTAMIPKARPPPCDPNTQHCAGATQGQYALLLLSFGLMSIGAGGIRSGSLAFGADQIVSRDNLNNVRTLESFFGWYYASFAASIVVGFVGIGYLQKFGWKLAFGVPAILMFLSPLVFCLASSLYVKRKASKSLFTGLMQVAVVAFKNRGLEYPPEGSNGYHYAKGSMHTSPSDKLRFLNKACIIKNPQDVTSTGVLVNNWNLCTIDQVEELKALIRLLPMLSTSIVVALSTYNTFPVVQASKMDRHLTKHFEIPPASFLVFSPLTITLWIVLYDRAIIPLASRIRGKKVYVGVKLRMGIGAFLISVSMAFVAVVEGIRRKKAIEQGIADNPNGIVKMSAMWVALEYCMMGLGEAFFAVSQNEFFYSEFPMSMSSIAGSFGFFGAGIGNVLGGVFTTVVDEVTKSGGKESWVATNPNKGHFDYVYWVLAALTLGNALYYVLCSWAYGPCAERGRKAGEEERLVVVEEDKVV